MSGKSAIGGGGGDRSKSLKFCIFLRVSFGQITSPTTRYLIFLIFGSRRGEGRGRSLSTDKKNEILI